MFGWVGKKKTLPHHSGLTDTTPLFCKLTHSMCSSGAPSVGCNVLLSVKCLQSRCHLRSGRLVIWMPIGQYTIHAQFAHKVGQCILYLLCYSRSPSLLVPSELRWCSCQFSCIVETTCHSYSRKPSNSVFSSNCMEHQKRCKNTANIQHMHGIKHVRD